MPAWEANKIRGEMKKFQNVIFEYSEIPYSLIILFWVVFVSVKWNLIKYYNLYSTLWWVIYFFLLIWNQLRSNCFINLITKSFYKLSWLRVLINRSLSTDLNLCPVDNTTGFPNTYQPDIKWIIRWTVRTIKLLNRPGAGRHSILCLLYWGSLFRRNQVAKIAIGWRTILKDNPLSPKSDQHKISPCKIQCFVKQSGFEDYGHDYTLQD